MIDPLLYIPEQGPRQSQMAVWSLVLSLSGITVGYLGLVRGESNLMFLGFVSVALAFVLGIVARVVIRRSEGRVSGSGLAGWGIKLGSLALLLFLLLPARSSARPAALRAQSLNNLKQIGLALLNYESSQGRFPPAVVYSPEGRPLYSWRVLILPYLEESALYDAFNLNEPWDGPTNIQLLGKRPSCYHPLVVEVEPSMTFYQALIGPGTAFEDRRGERLEGFTDPPGSTLLVVEASQPVPWSRPLDLAYLETGQLPSLGILPTNVGWFEDARSRIPIYNALFANGRVTRLAKSMPEGRLRALITRNGGEPIDPDGL